MPGHAQKSSDIAAVPRVRKRRFRPAGAGGNHGQLHRSSTVGADDQALTIFHEARRRRSAAAPSAGSIRNQVVGSGVGTSPE